MSPEEVIARTIDPQAWDKLAQDRIDYPADHPAEFFMDDRSMAKAQMIIIALHMNGYVIRPEYPVPTGNSI